MKSRSSFFDATSKLISARLLKALKGKSASTQVSIEAYQIIFATLVEVMEESKVHVTNEAMNYLAQQYYDAATPAAADGASTKLDPNIFTQRAKLQNIATKELAFLAVMLRGTDFTIPIFDEIKRRQ